MSWTPRILSHLCLWNHFFFGSAQCLSRHTPHRLLWKRPQHPNCRARSKSNRPPFNTSQRQQFWEVIRSFEFPSTTKNYKLKTGKAPLFWSTACCHKLLGPFDKGTSHESSFKHPEAALAWIAPQNLKFSEKKLRGCSSWKSSIGKCSTPRPWALKGTK